MNRLFKWITALTVALSVLIAPALTEVEAATDDVIIVIDPGHGGQDPGSIATTGAYEKDCNYAIAQAMMDELNQYEGVQVYMTRSKDEWLTNTGRAMVAATLKADFLISIHNNSGSSTSTGAIAYCSLNEYYNEPTREMGALILNNLEELGLANGRVQTRVSTTYTYEDYYTLIAESVRAGVPAVLIEHCFLSNENDAAFVSNSDGSLNMDNLKKMGVADANAVVRYFGLTKRTGEAPSVTKTPVALVGGVDPTFYSTAEELQDFDKESVFAYIIYSDGSAKYVKPDTVGDVDESVVGIQDIAITYDDLKGFVRICYNNEEYVPEVTLPAPKEETTEADTQDETQEQTNSGTVSNEDKKDIKDSLIIYIIVFAAVLVLGIVILIVEKKRRRRRRRRNRSRKYL